MENPKMNDLGYSYFQRPPVELFHDFLKPPVIENAANMSL